MRHYFKVWLRFRAPSREVAEQRSADARRGWLASKIFEIPDREFDDLFPGLAKIAALDENPPGFAIIANKQEDF